MRGRPTSHRAVRRPFVRRPHHRRRREPALWARFCEAIERPDLVDDPRFRTNTDRVARRRALKQELESTFEHFTVDELTARFAERSVPCGRVRSMPEGLAHPQVAARDTIVTQQRRDLGRVDTLAHVVKLSRTPACPTLPPPVLGEHTQEVLTSCQRSATRSQRKSRASSPLGITESFGIRRGVRCG